MLPVLLIVWTMVPRITGAVLIADVAFCFDARMCAMTIMVTAAATNSTSATLNTRDLKTALSWPTMLCMRFMLSRPCL